MAKNVLSKDGQGDLMAKHPTSFRLSEECLQLIDRLAKHYGISQTSVVEMLVRKAARAELSEEPAETTPPPKPNKPKK